MTALEIRQQLLATLDGWAKVPVWYEWGGKQYPAPAGRYGLDCSGTVCLAMELAGLVPAGFGRSHNAQSLFDLCLPVQAGDAQPGDLVFYGPGPQKVNHVMMLADADRVVGASGGGSRTTTIEIAKASDARVKYLPRTYRRDVVGHARPLHLPSV